MQQSQRLSAPGVVLTFYPHPVELIRPEKKRERLFTTSEKLSCLEEFGIPYTLVAPFDTALASLSPEDFFDRYVVRGLKAKSVTVGFDFRFGHRRAGDTKLLQGLCESHGIHLGVVEPYEQNGVKISSSLIRESLRRGAVDEAARWLGRPYSVSGLVSHGDNRGEKIGFPTANLQYPEEKLLPREGVYVTRAIWQRQVFSSVTNVGKRPTFHDDTAPVTIEVHLIDFKARLYDETIKVEFIQRIRDEVKFSSVEQLVDQIKKDVQYARDSFSASS